MLASLRSAASARVSARAFSTTSARGQDLAKLTLIGRLGAAPEARMTKNNREFVSYNVATNNYPPPPPGPDGTRAETTTTWHHVLAFNPGSFEYLKKLQKGQRVYVEAAYELREPPPGEDGNTPQGQRQIFLRHETIRSLERPRSGSDGEDSS